MKNVKNYLLIVLAVVLQLYACGNGNDDPTPTDSFDVQFVLPSSIDVSEGGEYTFSVIGGGGEPPLTTDQFILESAAGISYVCKIVDSSAESFTVRLASECVTGYYNVFIKRDTRKKSFGKLYINIVDELPDFTPDENTTVYGIVATDEGGVAGVVVSDGEDVTVTDERGIYQLKSKKKWGYVFISVPSGYEVPSAGVLPLFHDDLKSDAGTIERVDFALEKLTGSQDTYKVFMLGDMHLANRTGDLSQFRNFTSDLTDYMSVHSGELMYAIALGDMTWDLYWYSKNFSFPEYLKNVNEQIKGLQIFHTMGNHDNDYKTTSDFAAALPYVNNIAPTYYSFNIGKVHYIVLDDIDCSNYDGTDSRDYEKRISDEQLSWLQKDLAYVDKATPLVVATHAQLFYPLTTNIFKIDHDTANTQRLFDILNGYKVHFVTGHTHMMFNVTPEDAASLSGNRDFYEHNSGSICGSWWWSGYLTPGINLGQDGTPGGYAVWDITGSEFKYFYKATGYPEDYQFRSYDLNEVAFSTADIPDCPASVRSKFQKYIEAYPESNKNEVLINIWNWNRNWTLTVIDENGKELEWKHTNAYDPLHIAALTVPRFNDSGLSSAPNFITNSFSHFFMVTADNADADLTITVRDEFGHEWTENMQRPKVFSTDAYKNK